MPTVVIREAILVLLVIGLGYQAFKPAPACPTSVVETVQDHKVDTKVEQQHKTIVSVTKTTHPDGTVIQTTTTEKDSAKVSDKSDDKIDTKTVTKEDPKDKYEIGVNYLPSVTRAPRYTDTELTFGARLGNTDLWGTGGFDIKNHQVKIGISYHW